MPFRPKQQAAKILVYAFSRTAQFSLTAGDASAFRPREIEILAARAADLARLMEAVGNIASSGFRLGNGTVLMLGVPVSQLEQSSGRRGLCVVYAAYAERRQRSSAELLVNMISAFSASLSMAISGTYMDPARTADAYTKLLQNNDNLAATDLAESITAGLSTIVASLAKGVSQKHSSNPADYYSAVSRQAASTIRTGRVQFCYYIHFSPKVIRSLDLSTLPLPSAQIRSSSFLPYGIILGYSFRSRTGLPAQLSVTPLESQRVVGTACSCYLRSLKCEIVAGVTMYRRALSAVWWDEAWRFLQHVSGTICGGL